VALQEMANTFFGNHKERRVFLKTLERVRYRLADVEKNGYSPPDPLLERANSFAESEESSSISQQLQEEEAVPEDRAESTAARKRKKKKKKKQAQKEAVVAAPEVEKSNTAGVAQGQSSMDPEIKQEEEDPLVTALMNMGFLKDQISAAVKACGGTNRATADDLVTWILGQDADGFEGTVGEANNDEPAETQQFEEFEVNESTVVKTMVVDDDKMVEEAARQQEEAALKLAAQREEKRRRNREWNNREQARQQEKVKAKIAQSMAKPPPAAAPPGYSGAYPSLLAANPLETGIPNGLKLAPIAVAGVGLQTGLPLPIPVSQPANSNPIAQPTSILVNPAHAQAPHGLITGAEFPALSQSAFPRPAAAAPQLMVAHAYSAPPVASSYGFPPIGDDDRTVSSFGSNRGQSVSSNSYVSSVAPKVAPPGFRAPQVVPTAKVPAAQQSKLFPAAEEESVASSFAEETNPMGEIRATAKAFIPRKFSPVPPSVPAGTSMPQLSNNFIESFPPLGSQMGTSVPGGLLQPGARGPPPPPLSGAHDRMTSGTPLSEDLLLPPSATSSLTGAPSLEEPTFGIPLGFGNTAQQASVGNTSSLLTSAFTNGPPIGGSSLWGDTQSVPSFGGLLPGYSFGDGNDREKSGGLPNNAGLQGANWGASNLPTGGPGSIW
jgi:hypothetical protein